MFSIYFHKLFRITTYALLYEKYLSTRVILKLSYISKCTITITILLCNNFVQNYQEMVVLAWDTLECIPILFGSILLGTIFDGLVWFLQKRKFIRKISSHKYSPNHAALVTTPNILYMPQGGILMAHTSSLWFKQWCSYFRPNIVHQPTN